ncbi:MAG: PHB depolymerase family esterase [Candidatus Thermoplasmatota archaeon]|nr:PHB depolymerase family esterase [Candidatus Thermoplasmatota archaeon]
MKKKLITLFFFLLFIMIVVSIFSGCVTKREPFEYEGMNRSYVLHLPESYDSSLSYPLVMVFHGGGGNARNIERVTGFSQKADEEEFIVVYPDGTGRFNNRLFTWNAGFCCGYAFENDIDDVGYIKALITSLLENYSIDSTMIYATGISNGGILTYLVASELSDIFAAVAPVAAQIGGQASIDEEPWQIPEPEHPVSVIVFNGMNDSRVPYEGGRPLANDTHVYSWFSTNDSISFWIEQNQCNPIPKRNISESGNIIIDTYHDGLQNTEVVLVTIVNGTHSWPGGEKGRNRGDEPTSEINATDLIWEFFKNHKKSN